MTSSHDPIAELDWLVFSAHKTATQTAKAILLQAGLQVRHAHNPENLGLTTEGLAACLRQRARTGPRRLQILSVFRLPIERHVSSFFQWYGSRPVDQGLVDDPADTQIARLTDAQLSEQLQQEILQDTLVGREESIAILCDALALRIADLHFDPAAAAGSTALAVGDLHLLRFDQVRARMAQVLSAVTGTELDEAARNRSEHKWYADRYRDFTSSLRLPRPLVEQVHEARRDLIDLFYPGGYDEVLGREIARWST